MDRAADAASHLFFAYLRSLSPESAHGKSSILNLPRSLQQLLESTEYPPSRQEALQSKTAKVVMIVETVSPTPFALLRRAKNFHYREEDEILQQFSDYDDPVSALTDECRRVLKSIASANDSTNAKNSTSLLDPSWSRFEDIGFSGLSEELDSTDKSYTSNVGQGPQEPKIQGLRTTPASKTLDLGRPTTPSWADFLSSGFQPEQGNGPRFLLPPDKQLPPINTRSATSQSHKRKIEEDSTLEPGELASITAFLLDDTFWWVWMTSLAGEETAERKAAFGRCALVEVNFSGQWLVMEEIIKGAAPEPEAGAYIAEKKSRFGFSRKGRLTRSKSSAKGALPKGDSIGRNNMVSPASKTSIAPDQQARIQAAAAALQKKNRAQQADTPLSPRRARHTDEMSTKTNSVLTLQPMIMSEAAPAMKWANTYDKETIRAKYLGDNFAGKGSNISLLNGGYGASNASLSQGPATKEAARPVAYTSNKENQAPVPPKKPSSPAPRDEKTTYSKPDPALVDVINKGPPGERARSNERQPPVLKKPVQGQQTLATPRPPPPPPAKDEKDLAPSQAQAAAIPLPGETPAPATPVKEMAEAPPQYPRPMERKPVANQDETPSVKTQKKTDKQEANGTAIARPHSPESPKQNKLKKKNTPGGFKGMFSRKKDQDQVKPPRTSSNNSSAVAAARAALEAKAAQNQKSTEPPSSKVTSKRFSTLGRKKEPDASPKLVKETTPIREENLGEHPTRAAGGATEPIIAPPEEIERNRSTAGTTEEQRAEREFKAFDQGPLEDVPAFVPEDSPREGLSSHLSEEPTHPVADYDDAEDEYDNDPEPDGDGEELTRTVSPNDRWAQIRKNAADRAAARQSEEQSGRTDRTDRTDDDGDTSGEESKCANFDQSKDTNDLQAIESRVARIKARVAELTGNMDLPNNRSN